MMCVMCNPFILLFLNYQIIILYHTNTQIKTRYRCWISLSPIFYSLCSLHSSSSSFASPISLSYRFSLSYASTSTTNPWTTLHPRDLLVSHPTTPHLSFSQNLHQPSNHLTCPTSKMTTPPSQSMDSTLDFEHSRTPTNYKCELKIFMFVFCILFSTPTSSSRLLFGFGSIFLRKLHAFS